MFLCKRTTVDSKNMLTVNWSLLTKCFVEKVLFLSHIVAKTFFFEKKHVLLNISLRSEKNQK